MSINVERVFTRDGNGWPIVGFLIWRIFLVLVLAVAARNLVLQNNFLGGGRANYERLTQLWAWVNFDGEHYLSITSRGYQPLTYFYFPAYPLLVRTAANLVGGSMLSAAVLGVMISNISIVIALVGLVKIIRLDYDNGLVKYVVLLLLLFPTSFYFTSFYTESFFLTLSVWSFYFARRKKWLWAGGLGAVASATRVVGIILFPAIVIEYLSQKKYKLRRMKLDFGGVCLIPLGLIIYMYYLWKVTGDALEFLHTVTIFGAQRSSKLIMLPQVFYRYLFKVVPNLSQYWPVVWVTTLELAVAVLFLILIIDGVKKLRMSYWVYLAGGYLIPTLSGSFSSLPRYVIVLFPGFFLMAQAVRKWPRVLQGLVFGIVLVCLALSTAMFVRGYWVA